MIKNGLVMTIRKHYAIVLTPANAYEKIIKRQHMEVGMNIMYTSEDLISENSIGRNMTMTKKYISIASIVIILLIGGIFGSQFIERHEDHIISERINTNENPLVSTIITVDINPSFKLELDENQIVIGYEALNDDATKVNLEGILSLNVEDAIELIVSQAEHAGFINIEDLTDDYVLITVVNLSENQENDLQAVLEKLEEKTKESEALKAVNMALIQASQQEFDEAMTLEVPVGLIATGYRDEASVKSFFADENHAELFLEKGSMITQSFEYQLKLVEKYLNDFEDGDVLKNQLQNAYNVSKDDFYKAKEMYDYAYEAYQLALASGVQEDIDGAQLRLEQAEELKIMMNQFENQINDVKTVLRRSLEGEDKLLLEKDAEEIRVRAEEEAKRLENQGEESQLREVEQNRMNEQNLDEEKPREQEQNRQEDQVEQNSQENGEQNGYEAPGSEEHNKEVQKGQDNSGSEENPGPSDQQKGGTTEGDGDGESTPQKSGGDSGGQSSKH
ncbi:MAG: anti-sigma factor domain-containing protein [Clostridia bacterium]|nr:anti-sigma factor domain-containing protein [Clostridia bacterium]